jgi:CheY-like chemotaxis protein
MSRRFTVLCVDDDSETLALLRSALEQAFPGATVLTRLDAESGLVTLGVEPVDVVVSDSVRLDSGTPFVEVARNRYPTLPTVLYTGKPFGDVADVVGRAGVSEYVRKGAADGLRALLDHVERFAEVFGDDGALGVVGLDGEVADPSSPGWTTVARCDPSSMDELLVALVETLGDRADEQPLVRFVDVERLADLFASHTASTPLSVQFTVGSDEVVVTDDGVVAVRSLTSGAD